MRNIGLFEAKTKLSEICDQLAKQRQPVLITRSGTPLVRIDPIEEGKTEIWDSAKKFKRTHGPIKDDFTLPARTIDKGKSFLD